MELSLLSAFLGGVLTLLSPCSAMLLPAFFSYAFSAPRTLIARTGVFYLGLITSLVPLGVLAGTLGAFVNQHRFVLVAASSVIVIALGIIMLLNLPAPGLSRTQSHDGTSVAAVYLLGTVYGLAGVCAGPLLGAVLTYAAVTGDPLSGGIILLLFAAGMAFPLLVIALLWERLPLVKHFVRPRELTIGRCSNTWTGIIGGVLTIAVGGLLLVTEGTTSLGGILGATDQAQLESAVLHNANEVPSLLLLGVVVAVALIAWLLVWRRSRQARSFSATQSDRPGQGQGK